uniref:NADH-ubiquinone oxidoreductase chain 4L n=1 Tax=Geocalamus acutus TaxID=261498 RepID=Q66ST1_GEOAC|nr:NADH dehydrogenase subunit 4L [Geocalamus acutus]AAT08537.1 NADH dehydrogenase subunit 4L [Geocalamus acutus]
MTPQLIALISAFLLAMVGMMLHRLHFISILLCIESMMLSLYCMMTTLTFYTHTPTTATMPIMLLTLSACEASTGLALLVATIRTHSSDHMAAMNMLQC